MEIGSLRCIFRTLPIVITMCLIGMPVQADTETNQAGFVAPAKGYVLKLGRISVNPRKDYPKYKTLGDFLVKRLNQAGVSDWEVVFATSQQQMSEYVRDGKVDIVPAAVYTALVLKEQAGAELLFKEWRNGMKNYQTLFVTSKSSDINELSDLLGKRIAFETLHSTPSYFIPRMVLESQGLPLVEIDSREVSPEQTHIGYLFAKKEVNIAQWVSSEWVQAGTISSRDWNDPKYIPEGLKQKLRIFYRTEPFPRAVWAVRSDLSEPLKRAIKNVLLAVANDPEDVKELKRYRGVTGYELLEEGELALFDEQLKKHDLPL
ncbi:phosphate/phosphite/phosphonate ABC transporter substrate-binding protein [Photobacterium sp.]|uniref:phosphate/phosphite/phosphonate ABC transporter substrate-binding protein n=1 Tax=Photobacterium sp. TaxID=660 RepID=UPI00299DB1B4|nr:phosphate/phosphite/phosphonate ABC transporter substrate-binding protein [Photobacterium sp.]MDX1301364.1 phosphate/phosphite/phosphonate ABC transporter substrate-binding protein [Photobacterium sp.]